MLSTGAKNHPLRVSPRLTGRFSRFIPEGRPLPPDVWDRRHRAISALVLLHAFGLMVAGLMIVDGHAALSGIGGGMILAVMAMIGSLPVFDRRLRSTINSLALLGASAVLVHLSGGYIEMHFHFFVALAIIALYQDWLPFLAAVGFVLVEHGVVGVMFPTSVYNHASAWANPWAWAALHAVFVAAASTANLLAWRLTERQALHDPLTGLPNRTLFRDRVEHARTRARRRSEATAIILVNVDRFKPVNDTLGHDVGDKILGVVAERLRLAVRDADTVARIGGDEFAILLEDIADSTDATRIARRITDAFREPIPVRGGPVTMRVSLGIATNEEGADDVDGIIRDADVALNIAKRRGGDSYEVFEVSMRAAVSGRLQLEMELRDAVANNQLVLHYQPVVSLTTRRMVSVEALVRWEHPTRGMISPGDFIPIAEESRLIVSMGRWVLEEACRQAVEWHRRFPDQTPLGVGVNVSTVQLADDRFVQEVARILRVTGVSPHTITLEITETALMDDMKHTVRVLAELKALGVRLAIDDFGTGYSSLNYLQRMPIDVLKIDRAFVNGIERGGDQLVLARTICEMARTLSFKTIAEGIELPAQADRLRELGCELGQGFLYARPLPPIHIAALLSEVGELQRVS